MKRRDILDLLVLLSIAAFAWVLLFVASVY